MFLEITVHLLGLFATTQAMAPGHLPYSPFQQNSYPMQDLPGPFFIRLDHNAVHEFSNILVSIGAVAKEYLA
jgi:hypothetical protein